MCVRVHACVQDGGKAAGRALFILALLPDVQRHQKTRGISLIRKVKDPNVGAKETYWYI